jgi:uncharacterized membrane protein YfbV (UPF0208 family)
MRGTPVLVLLMLMYYVVMAPLDATGIVVAIVTFAINTAGCILVGKNQLVGQVLESRKWLYELKQKIVEAKDKGEAVWLTIR